MLPGERDVLLCFELSVVFRARSPPLLKSAPQQGGGASG